MDDTSMSKLADDVVKYFHDDSHSKAREIVDKLVADGTDSITATISATYIPFNQPRNLAIRTKEDIEKIIQNALLAFPGGFPEDREMLTPIAEKFCVEMEAIVLTASFISEAWYVSGQEYDGKTPPSESPNRKECVIIHTVSSAGETSDFFDLIRNLNNQILLKEMTHVEDTEVSSFTPAYYFMVGVHSGASLAFNKVFSRKN